MVGERAAPETRHLGGMVSEQMTAKLREKEYKIVPWYSNNRSVGPCRYFVYKDEDSTVTPGTAVRLSESGPQHEFHLGEASFKLEPIQSAEALSNRPIDLESPEFEWFRELRDELKPAAQSERPWVVVIMGCPGSGKTTFLKRGRTEQYQEVQDSCKRQLDGMTHPDANIEVPFANMFFKQLDDIIRYGARAELQKLWAKCNSIEDPNERFRSYWANKQHLFTRYALDKPPATDSNPKPQSYEFVAGAEMVRVLTQPGAQYNIVMETTGLTPGLVKFGLTAGHYANYNKLVILSELDNVEKAKDATHSRLIQELQESVMHGGEQFGTFLDVIYNKAGETFDECVKFGQSKNKELDAAASTEGRWFFHKLNQTFDMDNAVYERLDRFYARCEDERQLLAKLYKLPSSKNGYVTMNELRQVMAQLGVPAHDLALLRPPETQDGSARIRIRDFVDALFIDQCETIPVKGSIVVGVDP